MRTVEENGENEAEGRCTRVFEMRECEREGIANRLWGVKSGERSTEGPRCYTMVVGAARYSLYPIQFRLNSTGQFYGVGLEIRRSFEAGPTPPSIHLRAPPPPQCFSDATNSPPTPRFTTPTSDRLRHRSVTYELSACHSPILFHIHCLSIDPWPRSIRNRREWNRKMYPERGSCYTIADERKVRRERGSRI